MPRVNQAQKRHTHRPAREDSHEQRHARIQRRARIQHARESELRQYR